MNKVGIFEGSRAPHYELSLSEYPDRVIALTEEEAADLRRVMAGFHYWQTRIATALYPSTSREMHNGVDS